MLPLTQRLPKCLIPVAGKPLIEYWRGLFERHRIQNVLVNVHAHAEQVQRYVDSQRSSSMSWTAFHETELLGSAGTLHETLDCLERGPDYLLIYADNLSTANLGELVDTHRQRRAEFTMALFETPDPSSCGIATLGPDGRISSFIEKPPQPASNLANAGIYVISSGVIGPFLGEDTFDLGFDVLPRLVGRMHGWRIRGYHRDVGSPAALADIEDDLSSGRAGWEESKSPCES